MSNGYFTPLLIGFNLFEICAICGYLLFSVSNYSQQHKNNETRYYWVIDRIDFMA